MPIRGQAAGKAKLPSDSLCDWQDGVKKLSLAHALLRRAWLPCKYLMADFQRVVLMKEQGTTFSLAALEMPYLIHSFGMHLP